MKIKINITKDVLRRSMMCGADGSHAAYNCGIAVAVTDLLPDVAVGYSGLATRNGISICNIPGEALAFIFAFDGLRGCPEKRLELPEFSFEIEVPDEYLERTIGIKEAYEIINKSETLELA